VLRRLRLSRTAEQAVDTGHAQDAARVDGSRGRCSARRHERQHHELVPGTEVLGAAVDPVVEGQA